MLLVIFLVIARASNRGILAVEETGLGQSRLLNQPCDLDLPASEHCPLPPARPQGSDSCLMMLSQGPWSNLGPQLKWGLSGVHALPAWPVEGRLLLVSVGRVTVLEVWFASNEPRPFPSDIHGALAEVPRRMPSTAKLGFS